MSNITNNTMRAVSLLKYWYVLVCIGSIFTHTAFAQSANTPQLSVSPSIVRLDLATDPATTVLTYTNLTNQPMELSFQAQDFAPLENGYQLSFLSPKDANNYKYALSSWVQFSSTTLLLNPHESAGVTLLIQKDKLSPGGHYATILAKIDSQTTNSQQIGIKGILGSLLFVRTNTGFEHESASIPTFEIQRNFWDFPTTVSFRFNNTGDTDLTPYGLIQITDSTQTLVAKGIINQTSAPTLPESIRRYYASLGTVHSFILPGWYHATLSLHFGQTNKQLTKTLPFFTQGSIPFIPITGALILVVLTIWLRRKRR